MEEEHHRWLSLERILDKESSDNGDEAGVVSDAETLRNTFVVYGSKALIPSVKAFLISISIPIVPHTKVSEIPDV